MNRPDYPTPVDPRIEAAARAIHHADQPDEEDWELEDAAIRDLMIEQMMDVMLLLSEEDRELIDQLFFQGISARELARTIGVYHRTIIYRRDKVLEKLRRLMSE